jgi:diaminohydroxyphosphoribosylaminopyrimidine deaminase/5-amino-6-(5-phosphoribosylamino)uracil reductase
MIDYMNPDERFMRRALQLAARGIGTTHPNPRVGAVIVIRDTIVGEGWHDHPGSPHAEIVALEQAGSRARGATLYVNLEPCHAHGRTPPCTQAIIRAGIRKVVYASPDPNPKMAGGGGFLSDAGIAVRSGVLREAADRLNKPFFHFIERKRPYVIAKAAVSLDGKLATHQQHSRWISGEQARRHAQRLRSESDAILIGSGTLKHDNPSLTVRGVRRNGEPPLRVVLCFDTPACLPDYHLLDGSAPARLYVHTINDHAADWKREGVDVVQTASLADVMRHLATDGRLSLLLEGGGRLHAAFLESRLSDELVLYQSPILIGGKDAPGLWHGLGVSHLSESPRLREIVRRRMGEDQLIRGTIVYPD